jgi:hypothetical protein
MLMAWTMICTGLSTVRSFQVVSTVLKFVPIGDLDFAGTLGRCMLDIQTFKLHHLIYAHAFCCC